jgi:hypothetical protein
LTSRRDKREERSGDKKRCKLRRRADVKWGDATGGCRALKAARRSRLGKEDVRLVKDEPQGG